VASFEVEKRGKGYYVVREELLEEADRLMEQDGRDPSGAGWFDKSKYWKTLALDYIKQSPMLYMKYFAIGCINSFASLSTGLYGELLQLRTDHKRFDPRAYTSLTGAVRQWMREKTFPEKIIAVFIGSYLIICYSCLAVGFLFGWKSYNRSFLFLCLMITIYFIAVAGPGGKARMKLSAIPFYLAFVGIGVEFILLKWKKRFGSSP